MKLSVVSHNTQKGVVRRKLCRFLTKSRGVFLCELCLSKVINAFSIRTLAEVCVNVLVSLI